MLDLLWLALAQAHVRRGFAHAPGLFVAHGDAAAALRRLELISYAYSLVTRGGVQ